MGVAKGLGGGFPVGACLANEKAARAMTAGSHGATFGGNPLAMAVAEAVLDTVLEPGFLDHVGRIGALLRGELESLAARFPEEIEAVRGLGLMLGIKPRRPNTEIIARLAEEGLLAVGAGDNVVRLVPPLIIGEEEVAEAMAIMARVFGRLAGRA
jgi:acetylornithine/N-succinyldiaminopimelate aminotransferase